MRMAACIALALVALLTRPAEGQGVGQSRYFVTSDGVRLHYLEAGPPRGHTIVFVPGWTMPAWIWQAQISAFAQSYHVVAFDPRGQGDSDAPAVLDSLAYVRAHGDLYLAGLVLVDNSVGEEPPPPPPGPRRPRPVLPRDIAMHRFVSGMFQHRPSEAYLDRLTQATLRTPESASRALLAYPGPRTYWREAVYSTRKPVLYVVRPGWLSEQAANLAHNRPGTQIAVFSGAGHALFVDDAGRFNALLAGFLTRTVWP
jgi:non-heme chloroperoxidase